MGSESSLTDIMLGYLVRCIVRFRHLLVEPMNAIKIGGYKLGFWFAQQGSIYIFVGLIFFYAWRMGQIDRKFDVHE